MIYFDSAATTMQKPAAVARGMRRGLRKMASPGRGGHRAAMIAADAAYRCREKAAEMFSVEEADNVVFTFNATHGLNIAIKTLAHTGDRVIISGYEHNSVLRPLEAIGANIVVASSELFEPEMAVHAFESKITEDTKLVVINHVSNVFGYILPVERIAEVCKNMNVPFIIDASQSAGVLEVNAQKLGANFIAMPGHKGLYGPQGTGLLICNQIPETIFEGGSGSNSISRSMPDFLPDRAEAGTHNMPGICGLSAGLDFVAKKGMENILKHEQILLKKAVDGLRSIPGIRLFASEYLYSQAGVVSFNVAGADCEIVAEMLNEYGIAVRSGLHCSPLAHESADTLDTGTVRASFSRFNKKCEVNRFLNIVDHICGILAR